MPLQNVAVAGTTVLVFTAVAVMVNVADIAPAATVTVTDGVAADQLGDGVRQLGPAAAFDHRRRGSSLRGKASCARHKRLKPVPGVWLFPVGQVGNLKADCQSAFASEARASQAEACAQQAKACSTMYCQIQGLKGESRSMNSGSWRTRANLEVRPTKRSDSRGELRSPSTG